MKLHFFIATLIAALAIACQPESINPQDLIEVCELYKPAQIEHRMDVFPTGRTGGDYLAVPEQTLIQGDSIMIYFAPQYQDSFDQYVHSQHIEVSQEGLALGIDSIASDRWGSIVTLKAMKAGIYTISYQADIEYRLFRDSSLCGREQSQTFEMTIEVIGKVDVVIHKVTVDLPNALCDYDITRDDIKKCPDVEVHINALSVHSGTSWDYNFQNSGPITKILGDTVSVVENYWEVSLFVMDEDGLWGNNRGMAQFTLTPDKMDHWQTGTYTLNSEKWQSGTAEIEITRLD